MVSIRIGHTIFEIVDLILLLYEKDHLGGGGGGAWGF
jgi:hypothetical protein